MAENPLLNTMMSNMMQNSPIMQMVNVLRGGGNPQNLIQQMLANNAPMAQAVNSLQGKSPAEVSKSLNELASQRGIDLRELATSIGAPQNVIDQLCGGTTNNQG